MNDDKMTTIIAADYMYLVFLGDDDTIGKIMNKLNNPSLNPRHNDQTDRRKNKQKQKQKDNPGIYVKYEIGDPCIGMLDEEQIHNILLDDVKKTIAKKNISMNKVKTIDQMNNEEIEMMKKYVILDEGIEAAQCLTYADVSAMEFSLSKNRNIVKMIMLMVMVRHDSHFKLTYPILQLDEEENPDKLIGKWLRENNIDDLIKELTIRPVNIVGDEHEILVFTAHVVAYP
jgi:hypothetical protein